MYFLSHFCLYTYYNVTPDIKGYTITFMHSIRWLIYIV